MQTALVSRPGNSSPSSREFYDSFPDERLVKVLRPRFGNLSSSRPADCCRSFFGARSTWGSCSLGHFLGCVLYWFVSQPASRMTSRRRLANGIKPVVTANSLAALGASGGCMVAELCVRPGVSQAVAEEAACDGLFGASTSIILRKVPGLLLLVRSRSRHWNRHLVCEQRVTQRAEGCIRQSRSEVLSTNSLRPRLQRNRAPCVLETRSSRLAGLSAYDTCADVPASLR